MTHQFISKLQELGLSTNVELVGGVTSIRADCLKIENDPFILKVSITVFPNVQNYLLARNNDGSNLIDAANILKGQLGKVVDVAWEVEYAKYPSAYDKKSRLKLLLEIISIIRECLAGAMNVQPEVGMVLATYPYGSKVDLGPSLQSYRRGTTNREFFDRRLGFGKVDSEGWCYAIYNDDLKLMPL